jgi:hypothetical protein
MRRALWDDCPDDQKAEEILGSDTEHVFFAERPGAACAASWRRL